MKIIRRRQYLFALLLIFIVFLALNIQYSHLNKRMIKYQKLNMEQNIEQLCQHINNDLKYHSEYLIQSGEQIATEQWMGERIIEVFQHAEIAGLGYSFLIDGTGNLLAHPKYQYKTNQDLVNINSLGIGTYEEMRKKVGQIEAELGGVEGYLAYGPIQGTDWIIGSFMPLKEFQGNQNPMVNMLSTVFITAIFIFASFTYLYKAKSYEQLVATESELREEYTKLLQSQKELIKLSYTDKLTGLYNRRFFEEELSRLDHTENLPLTIIMADVNGLKLINDSFGHKAGDELLETVARIMKEGCRKEDIVARIGGDEFVVILSKTSMKEAEKVVSRIRKLSSMYKLKNKGLSDMEISVSFGVATKEGMETSMSEVFKISEDRMYKNKLAEGPSMRSKAVDTILRALYELSKTEELHSKRVANMAEEFSNILGLEEDMVKKARKVGLLHDIGKVAISKAIWSKPGKLSGLEMEEIKKHPEIGYRILNTVNEMSDVAEYVLKHHERYDGLGYPEGLKGEDIPLISRIIAIVSAYDVMSTDRAYRKALPQEQIIQEYKKNAGTQFDPYLAQVFVEKVLN